MKITCAEYTGRGMQRVYENDQWTVGIKNWKPENDITGISNIERHNLTDELFVLVSGSCTLVSAEETEEDVTDEEIWDYPDYSQINMHIV